MHDTSIQNGERFFATYLERPESSRILEVGAQNLNGALRDLCPPSAAYIGVDLQPYKGVDVVLADPYEFPFESASFDVVLSTSCLEHSEHFWLVYLEVMRVLKGSGLFYLTVPSNGPYHRTPADCWRFYPDSGAALVSWGRRNGLRNALLESYLCNQQAHGWADVVCVFIKDESYVASHPKRILDTFNDCTHEWRRPA